MKNMIKQALPQKVLDLFFLGIMAWPVVGQASPFVYKYSAPASSQLESARLEAEVYRDKAYNFITTYFPDEVNRSQCPITISFQDLKKVSGKAIYRKALNANECDHEEIVLSLNAQDSWQSSPVVAHEVTHLLRYKHNSSEDQWLDEGLAKYMESQFVGYWPKRFESLGTSSEFRLSENLGFLLVQYLYLNFGEMDLLRELINSPLSGWDNIEQAVVPLSEVGKTLIPHQFLNRRAIWRHFTFALVFNDTGFAEYGLFKIGEGYKPLIEEKSPLFSEPSPWPNSSWTSQFFSLGTDIRNNSLWVTLKNQHGENPSLHYEQFLVMQSEDGNFSIGKTEKDFSYTGPARFYLIRLVE